GLVLEYRPAGLRYQKLNFDYWATGPQPALRGDRTRRRLNGCLPPHQAPQTGYSEQAAPQMGQ
ncbi:MAG TPA: hypothetical protein VNM37_19475, partial [Candidatus Dormibacteraeota bacterium]|nr:hypothetical protein [Candidatus Dormibacteraeota bacterium]